VATLFPDHADLYHTGIVVHDLAKAKAEMCEQLGLTWGVQGESEQPVVLESGPARLTLGFAADPRMQLNGLNMLPDLDAGQDAPYGPVPVVTPREISNTVLFLASDEARYITGVALPVDAGNTNKP